MKLTFLAKGTKILFNHHLTKIEEIKDKMVDQDQKIECVKQHRSVEKLFRLRTTFGEELFVSAKSFFKTATGDIKAIQELTTDDFIEVGWSLNEMKHQHGQDIDWVIGALFTGTLEYNDKNIKFAFPNQNFSKYIVDYLQKELRTVIKIETVQKRQFYVIDYSQVKNKELYFLIKKSIFLFNTEKKLPFNCSLKMLSGYIESMITKQNHFDFVDGKLAYDLFYKLQSFRIYSSYYRSSKTKIHRVNIFDINNVFDFRVNKIYYDLSQDDIIRLKQSTDSLNTLAKVVSIQLENKILETYAIEPKTSSRILACGIFILNEL